ncbi:excalibur calcium-binding domain-containing protein [Mycobacterium sp. TY815]
MDRFPGCSTRSVHFATAVCEPKVWPAYGSWLDRDNDGIACESK